MADSPASCILGLPAPTIRGTSMRRLSLILAAVSLLAAPPAAQTPRTATIDAIVTDKAGSYIPNLTAAEFRVVSADNKVIPVTSAREVTVPLANRGKATAAEALPLD